MTIHVTLDGVLEVIGGVALGVFAIYVVYGLFLLWLFSRQGK